jgi:hypothetical protein
MPVEKRSISSSLSAKVIKTIIYSFADWSEAFYTAAPLL